MLPPWWPCRNWLFDCAFHSVKALFHSTSSMLRRPHKLHALCDACSSKHCRAATCASTGAQALPHTLLAATSAGAQQLLVAAMLEPQRLGVPPSDALLSRRLAAAARARRELLGIGSGSRCPASAAVQHKPCPARPVSSVRCDEKQTCRLRTCGLLNGQASCTSLRPQARLTAAARATGLHPERRAVAAGRGACATRQHRRRHCSPARAAAGPGGAAR